MRVLHWRSQWDAMPCPCWHAVPHQAWHSAMRFCPQEMSAGMTSRRICASFAAVLQSLSYPRIVFVGVGLLSAVCSALPLQR